MGARACSLVTLACAIAGCREPTSAGPPWDVSAVSARLMSAGFVVTSAMPPPIAGPGIVRVECIDAVRAGARDTLCVVQCSDANGCRAFAEGTWESYGTFRRGPSVLVHQVCGRPTGSKLSFDCRPVRSALEL